MAALDIPLAKEEYRDAPFTRSAVIIYSSRKEEYDEESRSR